MIEYITKNFDINAARQKYTIVFFWSNILNRESKRAFKTIVENIQSILLLKNQQSLPLIQIILI